VVLSPHGCHAMSLSLHSPPSLSVLIGVGWTQDNYIEEEAPRSGFLPEEVTPRMSSTLSRSRGLTTTNFAVRRFARDGGNLFTESNLEGDSPCMEKRQKVTTW
jgi:hypothetical protein